MVNLSFPQAFMPVPLAEKIRAIIPRLVGERREVTVLTLDLLDSTAQDAEHDSEALFLLIDALLPEIARIIYEYEGTIDKFTGSRLMALFGVPIAHENDPERAVRAALDLQTAIRAAVEAAPPEQQAGIAPGIGISAGQVLIGAVEDDLHATYTLIGDTGQLAGRLQHQAGPWTILTSSAVYQRTWPLIEYRAARPVTVVPGADPVQCYIPAQVRPVPERVRGLPGIEVPLIGRHDVMARLQAVLRRVEAEGLPQIVLITGEAGVGKSRLVSEFRRAERRAGVQFFAGNCATYTRSRPLWLFAGVLRDMMGVAETAPAEEQGEALQRLLVELGIDPHDALPYLASVLGLYAGDPLLRARLGVIDSNVLQKLVDAALRQVLSAQAQRMPTVLILDDLHWIDSASRSFLQRLIETVDRLPLALVMISRGAERETVMQPLIQSAGRLGEHFTDIKLEPLSESEGQELVNILLMDTTAEAGTLKRRIAAQAEGNPFFAEEIVRLLIDHGGLVYQDRLWRVRPQAERLLEELPGTVSALILARFHQLPPGARQTLQKAAVVGHTFPLRLLQHISSEDENTLAGHVDLLVAQQFLATTSGVVEHGLAFRHALIQKAIYGTLLLRDRRAVHDRVAEVVERHTFWTEAEQAAVLAYHYASGSQPARAIPYLVEAAESAERHGGYESALQSYRRVLEIAGGSDAAGALEPQLLLRAQIGLGRACKFAGEYTEAGQAIQAALAEMSGPSGQRDQAYWLPLMIEGLRELADTRMREGALDEAAAHLQQGLDVLGTDGIRQHPRLWRALVDRLAWMRFRQAKLEEAFALASSATLEVSSGPREDPLLLASLCNTLGGIYWQWGDLSEASRYVERSLNLYRGIGYAWGTAIALTNLGVLHYALGDWPQAEQYFEQAYILRHENGYLPEQALNLHNLGVIHTAMGEHERARGELQASLEVAERVGDDHGTILARIGLAQLAVIQQQFEQAEAILRGILEPDESAGEYQSAHAHWLWALAQAGLGRLEDGVRAAEDALEKARAAGLTEMEVSCRRVLGSLHGQAGRGSLAESCLREALDLSTKASAPYEKGLTLLELGRLYAARARENAGDAWQAEAAAALSEAAAQFERLGAAHDLAAAHAALEDLAAQTAADVQAESAAEAPVEGARGRWHQAVIVWMRLAAPQDADPEAVLLTDALARSALGVIAREYHGQIIQHEEGLTLVFGAPAAYEDDAERAVWAAWRSIRYLADPEQALEVPLSLSVAISVGDVVAGQTGPGLPGQLLLQGEPVREAQQIAGQAPGNVVWVTDAARRLSERVFTYEPVGGLPPGAAIWQLVGLKEAPAPARGLPDFRSRFIGREQALQAMQQLAGMLERGVGGLIWIEGEPGIGKSRLMREFAALQQDSSALIWQGKCSPQKSQQAFALFSDLFGNAIGMQPADTPEELHARLAGKVQEWPAPVRAMQPYLELLMGLHPSGAVGERLLSLEPQQLRQQTFVALRRLLKGMASRQPLIILLDDLHWVDPVSSELLLFVVTMVISDPILFVCAQRRQGSDLPNDRLIRMQSLLQSQTAHLRLERLTPDESGLLLGELLPQTALPGSVRSAILDGSEGNPYFIEEFVRMLIEQGYLYQREGVWEIVPERAQSAIPTPTSLETLIRSRIDALPEDLREVVQGAAAIGVPFEASLLEGVVEGPDVRDVLQRLESRLLVRRGTEPDEWYFIHSLVETVAYASMLKVRRKALHLKIASVLEQRWGSAAASHASVLAYHYSRADANDKAITYLLAAGEQAAAKYANEEAVVFFEQAAKRIDALPDVPADLRWRLAAGLGDTYRALGRYDDSEAALRVGLAQLGAGQFGAAPPGEPGQAAFFSAGLYRRLGDTATKQGDPGAALSQYAQAEQLLGAASDGPEQVESARVLTGLAWAHFMQGRFDEAKAACERSMDAARRAGALSELAAAENLLGGIYLRQNEWEAASHHTTRAMALREQIGYTWGVASTLNNLGILSVLAGQWDKAQSFLARSLALREELGDVQGVVLTYNNLATLARDRGELEQAEAYFRSSLDAAVPLNMSWQVANSTVGLAQVLFLKGQLDQAQRLLNHIIKQAEAMNARDVLSEIYRVRAEIWLEEAAPDEAERAAQLAAAMAEESGDRTLLASAWRVMLAVQLAREDLDAAQEALNRAHEALAGSPTGLESGRIAALASRLHARLGDEQQAARKLEEARRIFAQLGAQIDLALLEGTLEQYPPHLSSPRAAGRSGRRQEGGEPPAGPHN